MISVKRILLSVLITLFVLILLVELGVSTILFFKYVDLKNITDDLKKENLQLQFNRGKYIDLKTTIEEQRKEIMRIEERNALCLNKYEETLSELGKCAQGDGESLEKLNENNLME